MDTHVDWKDYQFAAQENDVSDDESDEKMQSCSITASAETELLTGMANKVKNLKTDKKVKSPKKGCKHKGCGKPVFARGQCYRHDQESKRAAVEDTSSDDEDDNIYPVRAPMRTIGTQTDDLPLVSDTSGHYAASVASVSSSSSDNTMQPRGLPKDDTTIDENSSSSSDSSQKPVEPMEPIKNHRAKSKQRLDSRSDLAATETETDQESELSEKIDQCTPHTNDVLLVAGHHSHLGNVQFCNAVSMCDLDFSEVPECFSAALKALSPPGRFLVKSVSDGGWKEINHDIASSIIPLIMDHHKLNGAHLYRRESLSFLARVQQKIESKFGGRPIVAKVPGGSSTLPPATAPVPAVAQSATAAVVDAGAETKETITNKCVAQTLRTFNIWHDENWRNKILTAFGVDTSKLGQNGTSLSQLSAEDLSQILEQSNLSAQTLLTCVLDAEVKSLMTPKN